MLSVKFIYTIPIENQSGLQGSKYLEREVYHLFVDDLWCTSECVFAPYFCYDQVGTHFVTVKKVFGASNVSKLLLSLPVQNWSEAAITISYKALARMQDPIYNYDAHIFALQQQVSCWFRIATIVYLNFTSHLPSSWALNQW